MKTRLLTSCAIFVGLWAAGVVLFAMNHYEFSYENLSRNVTPLTSAQNGVGFLTAELAVLFAVLWPPTFNNSWQRALVALVLSGCWIAYLAMGVMHAPGWFHANLLWILAVFCGLLVLAVVSAIASFRDNRRARSGGA